MSPNGSPASHWGVDWGEQSIWHWQGHCCHWRRIGDPGDPPLVLIHGFGAASGHWRHNAGALAESGWQVFAIDLLGFGDSSQAWLRLDNRLWARQLGAFLQQVVGGPAVLVGHSLGGLVALTCAVFFPDRVHAVAAVPLPDPALLIAMVGGLGAAPRPPRWRRNLKRLVVNLLCRLLPLELMVPLLVHSPLLDLGLQAAYDNPIIGDRDLRRVISRPARRPGAAMALRAMSIAMPLRPHHATAPALLTRLRQPMLLIWGRQDGLVPLEVALQCRRWRPLTPLVVLEGAGHCPHDERPPLFNRTLLEWLETIHQSGSDRDRGRPSGGWVPGNT